MHISSLAIYEGPPPPDDELRAMLERRLPLVPRFRQRLATVPLSGHRPVWIDDESFDIETHLQHVALFEPSDQALHALAGRILSAPLCRTRPLWEMWLITGLAKQRFAVLSKVHHSLWDGVTGVDLHAVILDDSPDAPRDEHIEPFEPAPEPNALGLLFGAARDRVQEAVDTTRGLTRAARDPRGTFRSLRNLARDATSFAGSVLRPAPNSELNERIGSRRRYAVARAPLNEIKDLRVTLGASVNDVILAGVAGAIRQWQRHRGLEPVDLRVMVPVSVRTDDDDAVGNRVAMVVVDLPVADRTSLMRLDRVHTAMESAKRSGHIAAGEAITRMSGLLPPSAVAAMTRIQSVTRPFNLVVTNIPGPQQPLYLLGRRLLELYPQAPLAANQGLSIGALSYNGTVGFGLFADHDTMADVDYLAHALEGSMDDLLWNGALDNAVTAEPSLSRIAELAAVR
jgi:WS/DGAT/MGAT family acyltransferase